MHDDLLIKECLKNKRGALDELYKKYAPKMFAVCLRYCKSRVEAEDLLQEGFIKVFTNLESFKGCGSLEGWIRRIVVNTCINYYRQKTMYFENVDTSKEAQSESATLDALADISAEELMQHIQNLPEGYRMVFNLYVIEGYQHKEIAEMLNVSENTSKTQLLKARKALQEKINNVVYEKAV